LTTDLGKERGRDYEGLHNSELWDQTYFDLLVVDPVSIIEI
jgi:hypothetical protein